jgi:hypothetical protein
MGNVSSKNFEIVSEVTNAAVAISIHAMPFAGPERALNIAARFPSVEENGKIAHVVQWSRFHERETSIQAGE